MRVCSDSVVVVTRVAMVGEIETLNRTVVMVGFVHRIPDNYTAVHTRINKHIDL